MSYSLDVELFISEVQKYPELWDLNCEAYRHKSRKSRAWGEVAKIFMDDFEDMSIREKHDIYKKLFSKWRNIRDSYVRHVKRKDSKKGYLYAKHLSFLDEIYKQNTPLCSDGDDPEDNCYSDDDSKLKNILIKSGCYDTKDSMWQNDDDTVDLSRKRKSGIEFADTNYSEATLDVDRSFFDSLLPAVRDFTIDQKLEFRNDVIKLVQNYRKKSREMCIKIEVDD